MFLGSSLLVRSFLSSVRPHREVPLLITNNVAVLLTTYLLSSIPTSLPPRLAHRIAATLHSLDYTHTNSLRISSEVRKILKFPAENLRSGLQKSVEDLGTKRDDMWKGKHESEVARKYFGNLVHKAQEGRGMVEAVDLEGGAPGVAGGFEEGMMV